MFHNDTAMRLDGGGRGRDGGKAEGEKRKINTTSALFPRHGKERGSIVGE